MAEGQLHERDWTPVTDPMFLADAEIIANVLEEEGILAKVADLDFSPYRGVDPRHQTGQILVPRQLLDKAREVLRAREAAASGAEMGCFRPHGFRISAIPSPLS